jgi:hypothetical protein
LVSRLVSSAPLAMPSECWSEVVKTDLTGPNSGWSLGDWYP